MCSMGDLSPALVGTGNPGQENGKSVFGLSTLVRTCLVSAGRSADAEIDQRDRSVHLGLPAGRCGLGCRERAGTIALSVEHDELGTRDRDRGRIPADGDGGLAVRAWRRPGWRRRCRPRARRRASGRQDRAAARRGCPPEGARPWRPRSPGRPTTALPRPCAWRRRRPPPGRRPRRSRRLSIGHSRAQARSDSGRCPACRRSGGSRRRSRSASCRRIR